MKVKQLTGRKACPKFYKILGKNIWSTLFKAISNLNFIFKNSTWALYFTKSMCLPLSPLTYSVSSSTPPKLITSSLLLTHTHPAHMDMCLGLTTRIGQPTREITDRPPSADCQQLFIWRRFGAVFLPLRACQLLYQYGDLVQETALPRLHGWTSLLCLEDTI